MYEINYDSISYPIIIRMNKVVWLLGAFLLSVGLLIVLGVLQRSIVQEGFQTQEEAMSNLLQSMNKIGKKLLDPEMWSERIQMMHFTPVELARKQLSVKG